MDKKSKILIVVVILSILVSVGYTFYKTVIRGDFEVVNISEEEDSTADQDQNQIDGSDEGGGDINTETIEE